MTQTYSSGGNRWLFLASVIALGLIGLVQPGCDSSSSDGTFVPATIASVFPPQNSDSALTGTNVIVVFGIDMNETTINASTFTLTQVGGAQQPATVSYDATTRSATLDPDTDLLPGAQYRAAVSSTVEDAAGSNPLNSDFSWSFTVSGSMLLLSSNSSGVAANDTSSTADIDAEGRYIVFESTATNLVGSITTGGLNQIYRKDTLTGEIVLASSDDSGLVAANRDCFLPRISADGRYVVFESAATNLDDQVDSGGISQIYLKDLEDNTTDLASRDRNRIPDNGLGGATSADVSNDGRYVVFQSRDPDLSLTPGNTFSQIYRKDTSNEAVDMISQSATGVAGDNDSENPSISPNGHHVVFESSAINLGAGNGFQQIFYIDLSVTAPVLELASTSTGGDANADSFNASVSDDGSLIVFETNATNLASLDLNGTTDVFLRDRSLLTTGVVSVNSAGTSSANGASTGAQISGNGLYVSFESRASDIDGGNLNVKNIFVRDLSSTTTVDTRRINIPDSGLATTSASSDPAISADGRYVSFDSEERYTGDDTDSLVDVYRAYNSTFQ